MILELIYDRHETDPVAIFKGRSCSRRPCSQSHKLLQLFNTMCLQKLDGKETLFFLTMSSTVSKFLLGIMIDYKSWVCLCCSGLEAPYQT